MQELELLTKDDTGAPQPLEEEPGGTGGTGAAFEEEMPDPYKEIDVEDLGATLQAQEDFGEDVRPSSTDRGLILPQKNALLLPATIGAGPRTEESPRAAQERASAEMNTISKHNDELAPPGGLDPVSNIDTNKLTIKDF